MTGQHKSLAALRTTAIIFGILCCSATALGAAAPLAFSPHPSALSVSAGAEGNANA